jgi:hypothetical protein
MRQLLVLLCLFVVVAGTWLGVMEDVLRHEGYAGRSVVAAFIALQAVATLFFLWLNGHSAFRGFLLMSAAAIVLFGAWAILEILQSQHFEGFVLLMGLALILQGALTVVVLFRRQSGRAA